MNRSKISNTPLGVSDLKRRALPEGGFSEMVEGHYRPDATAWAAIALSLNGVEEELLKGSRCRLTDSQIDDGRIPVARTIRDAIWPTPLAILAWQHADGFSSQRRKAVDFLLNTSGKQMKKASNTPNAEDSSIKAWPWVLGTYSWVEPTALAVMALRVSGFDTHQRVKEGIRMLLDRQLPSGGWNYGNAVVFQKELSPMPEDTGMALAALSGAVPETSIGKSIDFVSANFDTFRTPLSLGYAVLGLSAWDRRPESAEQLITKCLGYQAKFGPFGTSAISILAIAHAAHGGIIRAFLSRGAKQHE